jgi:poly-gamma-glutamate system protein
MQKLYWRPPGISRTALVLVTLVSLAVLVATERFPVVRKQTQYAEKMAAARLAREGMEAIKAEKQRRGYPVDPKVDPAQTGMIGESLTPVTSNTGFLDAKQMSTNPNFAAVILHLLHEAGVKEGDVVACGLSGSFPALNVSTFAALKVLGARPIVIASTSSSEWGANNVDYLWLDMEKTLRDKHLMPFRTTVASYGGIDDLGIGITHRGLALLEDAIQRNGAKLLVAETLEDSIEKRMAFFDEMAGDAPIRAYINVGGGSASVGTHVGKKQFKPGLNLDPPGVADVADSVMYRFAERDVPVIHISRLNLLAERFGLPLEVTTSVPIGQGTVFVATEYNRILASLGLVAILALLIGLVRYNLAGRFFRSMRPRPRKTAPEQMV